MSSKQKDRNSDNLAEDSFINTIMRGQREPMNYA